MANAIGHQDNGDGTVTEWYDDGSSQTWVIDTGQGVSSTPATPPQVAYDPGPSPTALWGMAQADVPPPVVSRAGDDPASRAPQIGNGGQVQQPSGGSGGSGSGGPSEYERLLAENGRRQAANEKAQLAYQDAMLRYQNDSLALQAARDAWTKEYQQQSLSFQREQEQNRTGTSLLQLGSTLRGPSNYLQYLRTLSNTTGGMREAVNALAGRFNLSRQQGTAPGSTFERQGLDTIVRDINATPAADVAGLEVPSGNQWNARNFNILARNPAQVGLLQSLVEEQGKDWNTEYANYLSSLPRFQGSRAGRIVLGT